MEIIPNIIGYHCNDQIRCGLFIKNPNYLIKSMEDGIWLGAGMYFWDNLSNANYWYHQKCKNRSDEVIVYANILLDHMLDLSDSDRRNQVGRIWERYCNGIHKNSAVPLGQKLNTLFNVISSFDESYYVLKIYGKYHSTPQGILFTYDLSSKKPEPTAAVKCIYCVKKPSAAVNRHWNKLDER